MSNVIHLPTAPDVAPRLEPVDLDKPADTDRQLWSVTTIIKAVDDGEGLIYWGCERSAVAAIHRQNTWRGMLADCDKANEQLDEDQRCRHDDAQRCDVVRWLRDARRRPPKGRRSDSELGTEVHRLAEQWVITGTKPEIDAECEPFMRQLEAWLERAQPTYEAAEMTVYNPTYGYAGTLDAVLSVGGVRFATDYKTSRKHLDSKGKPKRPRPAVGLQLAGYRHAEFAAAWRPRRYEKWRRRYYLLSDDEVANAVPIPEVDAGLAIMITPEFCHAYPVDIGDEVFTSFLYALEAHRWNVETSRTVIAADPLEV